MLTITIKNKILSLAFMLCMSSLIIDCASGGGGGGGTPAPAPAAATCQNGVGALGACTSCNAGFKLEANVCNPIPGALCENGVGSAGACTSCNTGYGLLNNSCYAEVTVNFDANKGTGGSVPAPQKVITGQSFTLPNLTGFTRTGYAFLGWSTLSESVGANFARVGGTFTVPNITTPSSITLYATWGANYTVTYNLNGGVSPAPSDSSALAGVWVTLSSPTPANKPSSASSSPNNGFFAWGENANGTGTWYTANQSLVFASSKTIYALWYYPINYNCGDGTPSGSFPSWATARTGEVLTNLTTTGCVATLTMPLHRKFVGWSTTGNIPYITTMPNGPITLKAVYTEIVDIDANGFIDIKSADRLNDMRYNLAGTSLKTSTLVTDTGNTTGCPGDICRGYELTADIDLANTKWGNAYTGADKVTSGWEPVGSCALDGANNVCRGSLFTASFEGRGFAIRNLYINRTSGNDTGFFGAVSGSINQVALLNATVRGSFNTGALVGVQSGGTLSNSYATGSVTSSGENTGGLVGRQNAGIISYSYATGSVTGSLDYTGGLVGVQNGDINNSYATGSVTGSSICTGGLVGIQNAGTISYSFAAGSVTSSNNYTGGLVGQLIAGNLSNSYATGSVTGSVDYTGGLVGRQAGGTLRNSYATGSVTSSGAYTGGLVGYQVAGTLSNSYATGSVTGTNNTGGLVGSKAGINTTLSNSYATGWVTGSGANTGGLVGQQAGGTFSNNYFDTETTGRTASQGVGSANNVVGVIGLATAQMQATSINYPSLLGACFNLRGNNKYPQLYTFVAGVCTTTPLFGPGNN